MKSRIDNHKGFSLTELMIAMAVGSIIMAVIYSTYQAQQKSYTNQQVAVEMQQNIRAAMSLIKREIRMAGYDPLASDGVDNDAANGADDPGESSGAGILSATGSFIQFSFDNNANSTTADPNESLTYGFTSGDIDLDGIADDGAESLSRVDAGSGTTELIAYDIQGIAFAYAFDDDGDGQLDITPGNGNVIWAVDADDDGFLDTVLDTDDDGDIDAADTPGGVALDPAFWPTQVDIANIRAVRIWVLARSRIPIRGHSDNRTYVVGAGRVNSADDFQRRLLVDTVNCRNMGL
ncbi:MAG: prepilin-type N-terminal cleavage/methylation domain-containing protein [Desulfobacterales bacterium]|nr:prepilin-type N-terminal cleavage/methylation domain-containing protein [Desulfobacterales bacterium]